MRSRPATFSDRGVCRPTIPSAGRTGFDRGGVPFGVRAGASPRIAFRFSLSGDCFVTREAFSAAARLVERIFRLRGSTAPVVGVDLGARPFLGRVLACLCFLPNRFLSSLCATECPTFSRAPIPAARLVTLNLRYPVYYRNCKASVPQNLSNPPIVYQCSHLDHAGSPGESPKSS